LFLKENRIFVGTHQNELEVRSISHGNSLESLVHFTKSVSTLYLSNSLLFIGTKDFQVAMINFNDNSNQIKYFHDHQGSILSLNVYDDKRWLVRE